MNELYTENIENSETTGRLFTELLQTLHYEERDLTNLFHLLDGIESLAKTDISALSELFENFRREIYKYTQDFQGGFQRFKSELRGETE